MTDEALRWDESMWRAVPPEPKDAEVIKWLDDGDTWIRRKVGDEPVYVHRYKKADKIAAVLKARQTILRELRRHPGGITTLKISQSLNTAGTNATRSMVAGHLKRLREQGLAEPDAKPLITGKGGRIFNWRAVKVDTKP